MVLILGPLGLRSLSRLWTQCGGAKSGVQCRFAEVYIDVDIDRGIDTYM